MIFGHLIFGEDVLYVLRNRATRFAKELGNLRLIEPNIFTFQANIDLHIALTGLIDNDLVLVAHFVRFVSAELIFPHLVPLNNGLHNMYS